MTIESLDRLKPFDINIVASGELRSRFNLIIETISRNTELLKNLEASDTGKSVAEASNEIDVVLNHFKYASELLRKRELEINEALRFLDGGFNNKELGFINLPVPKGLIAVILPYNFPAVVLAERLPYMLAAGNAVVVKPSEIASGSVPEILNIVKSVLGENAVSICVGDSSVGEELVKSPKTQMISFTGSTQQGVRVAEACARQLKPYSLELGGNNLAVIDSEMDFHQALGHCVNGVSYHSGQCCISTRKIFVRKGLGADFETLLRDELSRIVQSGSMRSLTSSSSSYHKFLSTQESDLCSHRITNPYGPDLLFFLNQQFVGVDEIFGPVIFINEYSDEEELQKILAVQDYGLALQIFSTRKDFIRTMVEKADFGRIWINSSLVSDSTLRIGGSKKSGNCWIGGESALYDYSNFKAMTIEGFC